MDRNVFVRLFTSESQSFYTIDFKTPFEIRFVKPASYNNLQVFRCPAYKHKNQGKFTIRALKR